MKDIVRELIKKWVATQNEDGSVGVVFPEETKIPSCVLQKKDGTGLYLTSDLAAIKYRMTNGWNPSKIIYCVDVRQQLHLRQAIWIAKKAWGLENVELFHAFNGFIKLKEGAMSTRHGTVIFLEDLITEGSERTSTLLAEKWRTGDNTLSPADIEAITIGAIKYSYLSQDREKDVTFDWDKALNFEWNSGPYIQYACVRAAKIVWTIEKKEYDYSQVEWLSQYDTALIRTLAEMEQKIQTTADTYKPHTLALYCYDLAVCFNSFYVHTPKILEETDADLRDLRLHLCRLTAEKLALGFDLLAIQMPSEM
jgi:arginyl-tRNA synthetase